MSEYLSRELDIMTKDLNKRLADVVSLLLNQYGDHRAAADFIDTMAACLDNEMFAEADTILDRAERDPADYFDLPAPSYDKDVLEDDEPFDLYTVQQLAYQERTKERAKLSGTC